MDKRKDMNMRASKLSDWLLRMYARKIPMNGMVDSAILIHEQQAYIKELETKLLNLKG